jgi:hypothetical protein
MTSTRSLAPPSPPAGSPVPGPVPLPRLPPIPPFPQPAAPRPMGCAALLVAILTGVIGWLLSGGKS